MKRVEIPGSLVAVVEHGRVVRYEFLAHANDAGYFGAPAIVIEDDDNDEEIDVDEFFDMVAKSLMLNKDTAYFSCELVG